eukprot:135609_1
MVNQFSTLGLVLKYGKFVPDTDFIFGYVDGNAYGKQSDWMNYAIPFFISEGKTVKESQNKYPLYTLSRGWLKFEHTRQHSWLIECLHRNNIYSLWEEKKNIIEFRGRTNGGARGPIIKKIVDEYGISYYNNGSGYNIAFSGGNTNQKYIGHGVPVNEEIKYKFVAIIDGNSVRDAFHKQALYKSVLYKDRSNYKEWW